MKAAVIKKYGDIDQIEISEYAEPILQAGTVLVKINTASINPLDLKILNGKFKAILPIKFPFILGNDFSGEVLEVANDVTNFKVGDEVYGQTTHGGAFAEYIAISTNMINIKPKNISIEKSAALPLVSITAFQALVEIAKIKPKQKVLIHGGSGGVGSIAIQIAKSLGAFVATTISKSNAMWVKNLGTDLIIDYKEEDFRTLVSEYDVVLDTQGGKTLEHSLSVVKAGGHVISVAGAPDKNFAKQINARGILKFLLPLLSLPIRRKAKKLNVKYSFLFMQPNAKRLAEISKLIELGKINPIIDKTYAFSDIQKALLYVATNRAKGKVLIKF